MIKLAFKEYEFDYEILNSNKLKNFDSTKKLILDTIELKESKEMIPTSVLI